MTTVFDIETNGLLDVLTKIHVLSYSHDGKEVKHTHDYDEMRKFFIETETLVGHNIIRFDIPAVEKVLGIKVNARLVDTLALSWYLNHDRQKHGLEGYGVDYGVPKPVIKDWDSLTAEEYAHRCDEDVKINARLWRDLDIKLNKLYQDKEEKDRLIDYLSFKMDCAREQEALRWKLDVSRTQEAYDEIMRLKEEKVEQLADAMPKRTLTRVATQPKVMHKKDGELSSHGEKWVALCAENKMPISAMTMTVVTGEERGNPNSNDQVKDWLYSLGWKPRTYKFIRDKKTGDERQVEQIRKDGELCDSVKELVSVDPAVDLLDGLTVLTHRAGILKSFLECVSEDGYLQATVAGLTNTFRFKHMKPLVNLPSVDKPYGDIIRGVLTCPDGYVLAGADMTSLEDTTKRHYMKPLDPDYVEEMSREGFDPHLDLAKHAGVITQEDIDKHNSGERSLKSLRKNYKVVNYSATYGIGAPKLARETGMSVKEAKTLLEAFWSRNWSVEAVAKSLLTRELFDSMWVYNPVSKFWYALRSDKDRFSTLNQGTGVFCFDTWVAICRKNGIKTIGQFHDEIVALVEEGKQEEVQAIMHGAAIKLNEKVKLNVPLGCDAQFGKTYGEIH
jgi:transposase